MKVWVLFMLTCALATSVPVYDDELGHDGNLNLDDVPNNQGSVPYPNEIQALEKACKLWDALKYQRSNLFYDYGFPGGYAGNFKQFKKMLLAA